MHAPKRSLPLVFENSRINRLPSLADFPVLEANIAGSANWKLSLAGSSNGCNRHPDLQIEDVLRRPDLGVMNQQPLLPIFIMSLITSIT
jgi:hypothetical protein